MPAARKLTTTISTKGQVILPKEVRESRNWGPGTRLEVEQTPDGVLLRRAALFPPTRIEDVVGMLKRPGQRALTIEEMDEAVLEEARRRARD